jgi:hypothetical protein
MAKFVKGQSGNPGGRPKMSDDERKAWQVLAGESRERLAELIHDKDTPAAVVTRIAEIAANRAWGLPRQTVDLGGQDDNPLEVAIKFIDPASADDGGD